MNAISLRRGAAAMAAMTVLLLAGCNTPPAFQVDQPSSRVGTVVSINQDSVQNVDNAVGAIGGALIGGGLGSLIGGGCTSSSASSRPSPTDSTASSSSACCRWGTRSSPSTSVRAGPTRR